MKKKCLSDSTYILIVSRIPEGIKPFRNIIATYFLTQCILMQELITRCISIHFWPQIDCSKAKSLLEEIDRSVNKLAHPHPHTLKIVNDSFQSFTLTYTFVYIAITTVYGP